MARDALVECGLEPCIGANARHQPNWRPARRRGWDVRLQWGTNAIADFGSAMLVGVEFPFAGCWQVTGNYRDASLTYVLWLKP